jgi:4-amino-4-deoxy-L-arabinose transferase-like glycosyltransferase
MTTTTLARQSIWRGWRPAAALDFATRSHGRAAAVLVAFALLAFLPGFFSLPPTDRDESRFAQASKQMVETGDLVDIHFQDEVRYKKPVGIYWLQAGTVAAARALGMPDARTTIWLYRVPSLLSALGAVLLTYWAALAFITRRGAMLAALMLGGSILLGVEARLAKTDAALLFTVVAAMGAVARAYLADDLLRPQRAADWLNPAVFWTAIAVGFLLKGPVILMIVGLAMLALAITDRSLAWAKGLRPAVGFAWFLLLVLPWFLAIIFRSGTSFFSGSVGQDMMQKLAGGQESHGAPPGTYLLLFFVTFWPGAMLAGLAAPAVWQARREKGTKLLLAWLVPSWLVFELVMTKLPHYVLPLYPAVAILIAGVAERGMLSRRYWLELGTLWWPLFPALVIAAIIGGSLMLQQQVGLAAWPFAAAAILCGFAAWRCYSVETAEHGLLLALAASVLLAVSVWGVALPSMSRLFPSVALREVLEQSQCPRPVAAAAGFHEPSLVFLAGTSTLLTSPGGAAEFLKGGGCHFAFIEAQTEPAFLRRAAASHVGYAAGPRIGAFNYSSGRPITIAVYRGEGQP